LVGFVVGGALTPLFIGQWSGVGGAIGSSLTYLTVAGLMWYFFLRQDSRVALSVFAFRIADWNWMLGQIKAAWVRFRRTPT
ncbi:MAG: hypothetical protein ACK557_10180, partial [Planctomycetota bacterium]